MAIVPIGIVTRNRAAYLDVTLRSLSATFLPSDSPLFIFDDASDCPITRQYLSTTTQQAWPLPWAETPKNWAEAGLNMLTEVPGDGRGIADRVEVIPAIRPRGVVAASCSAVVALFERYPDAGGVFLLQDDVIFNADWYVRMIGAAWSVDRLGVLSGMRLNRKNRGDGPVLFCGSTAQCLYITNSFYTAAKRWFTTKRSGHTKFDDQICRQAGRYNHVAALINPFVCQHFGIVSMVRPRVNWYRGGTAKRGRIGYHSHPPYVLADTVRTFPPRRAVA